MKTMLAANQKLHTLTHHLVEFSSTTKLSGTDWLNWTVTWNEPNCWWTSRQEWFSAWEQAAITSAAYDGHCGTMPNTTGIKNADPTMSVSFGALANDSTQGFIDRWSVLLFYAKQERTGKYGSKCFKEFPAEAVNVHFYAQNEDLNEGTSPEDFNVTNSLRALSD